MTEPPELDRVSGAAEVQRTRLRLAERSRELDALQTMGRRAAAARSLAGLFRAVLSVVHEAVPLDLALVGFRRNGEPALALHVGRPMSADAIDDAIRRVGGFLGWSAAVEAALGRTELDGFDATDTPRGARGEEDVLLLPLVRGNRPVACLLALPAEPPDERRMRLLYGASNQISVHLERILRDRAVEASRFRSIVDVMPQGVLLTDAALRPLQANGAATRLLGGCGLDGELALGPGFERLGLMPLVEQVRGAGAGVAEREVTVDGDRVWHVSVSHLPGDAEQEEGLVFVFGDVTESRRMQLQLAQAEKMSSLGQMISGVAHELNNPLAAIVGYAQLIARSTTQDAKLQKRLEVLGRESERCRKIVQNLLSFARRHEPERRSISLNQVVENVVALMRYQLRVDGIRCERDLSPDLPAMEADAHQLEQVLVNLLTNAAHAIRETGETGTVTLVTRAEGGSIVLEIRDTGAGIPEARRSRIFDPFFTTKQAGEGTGLGLSLVYGIVTAHGGAIEALSHDGPGTTFRIVLPAGIGPPRQEGRPAPPVGSIPPRAGHVLVVDDDEAVATLICEALGRDGLRTSRVRDGRQALERLGSETFDLVICDVKMPDMNGARLYGELHRTHPGLARRLLWTTGDTLGAAPGELVARTGLPLLPKPFDLDELRDRVRERLSDPAD